MDWNRWTASPALITCLACAFFFLSGCDRSALGEEAARERLRKAFLAASANQDMQAMLDLYHWENVEPRYRQLVTITVRNELPIPVRSITFYPADPSDRIDFEFQGEPYVGNLAPRLRMGVEYESDDFFTSSYLLGFVDGEYRIINAVPRAAMQSSDSSGPENTVRP